MAESSTARSADDMFILATDKDSIKPDASSRKLIRRHVMKGKNRKAVPQRPTCGSWINHEQGDSASSLAVRNDTVTNEGGTSIRGLSPFTELDLSLFLLNMSVYKPPCTLEMMCNCGPAFSIMTPLSLDSLTRDQSCHSPGGHAEGNVPFFNPCHYHPAGPFLGGRPRT